MNINILSIYAPQQSAIEFSYSVNDGNEETETMSRDDFAKLLCKYSDGAYGFCENEIWIEEGEQISESDFIPATISISKFIDSLFSDNLPYCQECLLNFVQSLNKN